MAFWSNKSLEPLRKYRFQVTFAGDVLWYAKSVTKPAFDVSVSEYQLINHKIKYPGIVTWNDVEIIIIDSVDKGRADNYYGNLLNSGYDFSGETTDGIKKKAKHVNSNFTNVLIEQLRADGTVQETWELINPFVKSVKFGDLDYSSDDLLEIAITVAYDSAKITREDK
jgi:hypothetical protein